MALVVLLSGCTDPADSSGRVEDTLAYVAEDLPDDWATHALEATVGLVDPAEWPADDPLLGRVEVPEGTSDLRLVHGLAGHGLDPRDFQGTDLVARVWAGFGDDGYGTEPSLVDDAWALRALVAAGEDGGDDRLHATVVRLLDAQADDGGWAWNGGPVGDPDVTAWVTEALEAADGWNGPDRETAVAFLATPGPDGGYVGTGVGANCQSTGLALHALLVLGEGLPGASVGYLESCRHEDGGYRHKVGDEGPSLWATLDILPVLPYLADL